MIINNKFADNYVTLLFIFLNWRLFIIGEQFAQTF